MTLRLFRSPAAASLLLAAMLPSPCIADEHQYARVAFELVSICYKTNAQYFAEHTCDPAPFLTEAIFGKSEECEKHAATLLEEDPKFHEFKNRGVDLLQMIKDERKGWGASLQSVIVAMRIDKKLCGAH